MPHLLSSLFLVGLGICLGDPALAQEEIPKLPEIAPPTPAALPESCVPTLEKTICIKKVYLLPEQSATTLPKMTLREVEVCKAKQTILKLDWREEKRTCTEMVLKENTTQQEVICLTVKEEKTTDPATGKTCVIYKQVPETKKVTLRTYELVPVQKEYLVRFPCLKSEEKEVVVKKLEVDSSTIPAVRTRYQAVTVPCEMTLQVPVGPTSCPVK